MTFRPTTSVGYSGERLIERISVCFEFKISKTLAGVPFVLLVFNLFTWLKNESPNRITYRVVEHEYQKCKRAGDTASTTRG